MPYLDPPPSTRSFLIFDFHFLISRTMIKGLYGSEGASLSFPERHEATSRAELISYLLHAASNMWRLMDMAVQYWLYSGNL